MNQRFKSDKKNFTPAQKIGKESIISFVGMGYGQIIRYIFTIVLARLVGVSYLGLYSLGNSITTLASVLAKAGMDVGLMRFISGRNLDQESDKIRYDIYSSLKIGILLSVFVMVVLICISGWLVENIFHESTLLRNVLIVNAIAIPFITINLISIHATQGFQLLKYKIFIEYILNPTILLISVLLIYITLSAEMVIILPLLLGSITCSIFSSIFLKRIIDVNIFEVWKANVNKEIIIFSLPIMFTVVLGTMLHWLDIIMLGYFTNAETVGLYHPIIRTAGIQNTILIAFSGIFTPMFSRYLAQGDIQKMQHIYRLVTRWILSILVPIFIFIILFAKKIMLLFGTEFIGVANILILLTIGTSIFALFGIGGAILVVSGYQKLNLTNTLVAALLNIVLNIILIPRYGLAGAAWATVISLTFIAIVRLIETQFLLKINPFYMKDIKTVIAGLITFGFIYYLKPHIMHYHTVVTLVSAIIGIALIYLALMVIFKLDEDDVDFLRSILFLKSKIFNNRK
jgi:O-antigen/teichoic acid export membrane protein